MKYLIPFVYGFSTRAKKIFYKFSFFAVIFFPALIVTLFANPDFAYVIPRFLIGFTAMYCVYEIGYIFNDTYTVRFEENPTHRLSEEKRIKVERLANMLVAVRIAVVIGCVIWLDYLGVENLLIFIIMLGILNIAYAFHNYFRNKANIATIFSILIFKYIAVPVLLIELKDYWYYAAILLLMIPVTRTIEFAGKKEYGIKIFKNFNHDTFRIFYYLIMSVVFGILSFANSMHICGFAISLYFLLFRLASYFALKSKGVGAKIKEVRTSHKEN